MRPDELSGDELVVSIEALREYRLRADLKRRVVIDPLILRLMTQFTKDTHDTESAVGSTQERD